MRSPPPVTWSLDHARNPERVAALVKLNAETTVRFDGIGPPLPGDLRTPRLVRAGAWFRGAPGRERDAAEAWAFEMKAYFHRGTGEQPEVSYAAGIYRVIGLIQTTHPGDVPDADGIVWFT